MSQSGNDKSAMSGVKRRARLVPRRQVASRSAQNPSHAQQTPGEAGLFRAIGSAADRVEARIDRGIERAIGRPLDRLAAALEAQAKGLTPAGRAAATRKRARQASVKQESARQAPARQASDEGTAGLNAALSGQPATSKAATRPAVVASPASAAPAVLAPAVLAPAVPTAAVPPAIPDAVAAPEQEPLPHAAAAKAESATGLVTAAPGPVADAPGNADGWARAALARAGVLALDSAPSPTAPWDMPPAADAGPEPARAAAVPGRSPLLSGLTPLDEPEDAGPVGMPRAGRNDRIAAEPAAGPSGERANEEDEAKVDGVALSPLGTTLLPSEPRLPDPSRREALAVPEPVAPPSPGSRIETHDRPFAKRKSGSAGTAGRVRAPAREPVRPSPFAKARLALRWQWAALRYRLRNGRVSTAPGGAPDWRARLSEGVSRRTLTRGVLAVVGSVAVVLAGHALFIAGLARWRAPAPVAPSQTAAGQASPAAPTAPGQAASGQAGAPAAPAPRLEPRTPQDFAALPAHYPLLMGLPIRPERAIILPAPNDALDGTTIRAGAQIIKLARVDGPDAYAVCEGADGAPWACGLRARAALHNLVSQDQLLCRPVTEIGQRERRHVCEIAGQDVARLMVSAGWLRPDIHSEWAYGADASRARAGGEGLWRGGWRIRQR